MQKGGVGDVMIVHLLFGVRGRNDMEKMDFLHYRLSLPGNNPTNYHKHLFNCPRGVTPLELPLWGREYLLAHGYAREIEGKQLAAGELWYMQPAMSYTPSFTLDRQGGNLLAGSVSKAV